MRLYRHLTPFLALAAFAPGCTLQEVKEEASPATPVAVPSVPTADASSSTVAPPAVTPSGEAGTMQAGGPGGMMPQGMGGPMSMPMAPLTKTPDLDQKIAQAEKSGDKKKIAAAYAERGTFRMNDNNAGPRVKYRSALEDYRKALATDPTNAEAIQNKKTIEDIYHQMGRPVPGEEASTGAKP